MSAHPSAHYASKSYWDARFAAEAHYEWLCEWADVAPLLAPFLADARALLVVGTGSSALPADLCAALPAATVLATDYSEVVIAALRAAPPPLAPPRLRYAVADMLDLPAAAAHEPRFGCLDAVIDKGALDALVSAEGDSWSPPPALLATSRRAVAGAHAALRPGGVYIMLSFSQPHFRAQHLLQRREAAAAGAGAAGEASPAADAAAGAASDDEWEADKNPGSAQLKIPPVEGSFWSAFEHFVVPRGLGIFCYVCTK